MFPCAMSAGIVSAEARIVRLHLSEAYHGAPERLLFLSLIFVIFACLSFSSFFVFLHLFNSFLFLFLYSLSILNTISSLFLVISIVRPQSGFYRFFLQFLSNPSSETSDRKLGNYIFCIWEAQLEMHTLDRLFIPTTFWKEHSAHVVLLALLQCGI